jgi:uncharacterized protein (TIGR02996 family)
MDAFEASLWREVAAHLDAVEPRLVLADYLMEHGQAARGELIVLQCQKAADPEAITQARILVARHWEGWLGKPLGGLLDPNECELRNGMLDVAVVGRMSTHGAQVAARSHELWTVRTARPGRVDAVTFARFACNPDLVNLARLDGSNVPGDGFTWLSALTTARRQWDAITSLAISQLQFMAPRGRGTIRAIVDALARAFPNLVELDLSSLSNRDGLLPLAISALPAAFPHLARVRLQVSGYLDIDARASLEAMPHVESVR